MNAKEAKRQRRKARAIVAGMEPEAIEQAAAKASEAGEAQVSAPTVRVLATRLMYRRLKRLARLTAR